MYKPDGCLIIVTNLSCGVAEITEAGILGMAVGVGSFANNDASILFRSRSLLLVTCDAWGPLGLDIESSAEGPELLLERFNGG